MGASGQRLFVSRAQVSDTARFQCVAVNEAGDNQRDFAVVVHGKILTFLVVSFIPTKDFCGYFSSCNGILTCIEKFKISLFKLSFQYLHLFAPMDLFQWFSTSPSVWNVPPMASRPQA